MDKLSLVTPKLYIGRCVDQCILKVLIALIVVEEPKIDTISVEKSSLNDNPYLLTNSREMIETDAQEFTSSLTLLPLIFTTLAQPRALFTPSAPAFSNSVGNGAITWSPVSETGGCL